MASYEVEHNISAAAAPTPRRRPDMASFFSALDQVDTSHTENIHAEPIPGDVAAVFRLGAQFFATLGEGEGQLSAEMMELLLREAEEPPRKVVGVSEEFMADLERVPKKLLRKTDVCPICNNPFLEDPYPLVVRLPCHKTHLFDLECIEPWLKLHPTCPLDRKTLEEKKKPPVVPKSAPDRKQGMTGNGEVEEEEEEYDSMYA